MTRVQPSDSSSSGAVERTEARVASAARALATISALLDAASSRTTFRRPNVMHATSAALVANAIATTHRQLRSSRLVDDVSAQRDTATAILALLGEAVARSNRFRDPGPRAGTGYATVAAALIATESSGPARRRWALGGLVATIWATTSAGRPDGSGLSITNVVTDTMGAGVSAGLARRLAGAFRDAAQVVQKANELKVAEAVRLERQRERARQHRLLHDSVLQVFEAIAADLNLDAANATALLEREVARLVDATDAGRHIVLAEGLHELQSFAQTRGLDLSLVGTSQREIQPEAIQALIDASREALTNIRKHARVTDVTLTVREVGHGVEITIEDFGAGFDPGTVQRGFGVAHSIHDRLEIVGGTSVIDSTPGRGTRVTLWTPS